jgi:hypothetical protein
MGGFQSMLWVEERMILRTIHRMAFPYWTILSIILIISIASGAGMQNSLSLQGDCSISRTMFNTWDSGSNGVELGGNSGSRILTSPGQIQYQTRDAIDARTNNRYNETGYLLAEGTSVFSESLSMHETDLGQSVDVAHSGIVERAEFDTAKFANDADISIGQKGGWYGTGMYFRDIDYGVNIDQSTNDLLGSSGIDYGANGGEHLAVFTNSSQYVKVIRPEFSFSDFGDSFAVNKTAPGEVVVNTTEAAVNNTTNETGGNIS